MKKRKIIMISALVVLVVIGILWSIDISPKQGYIDVPEPSVSEAFVKWAAHDKAYSNYMPTGEEINYSDFYDFQKSDEFPLYEGIVPDDEKILPYAVVVNELDMLSKLKQLSEKEMTQQGLSDDDAARLKQMSVEQFYLEKLSDLSDERLTQKGLRPEELQALRQKDDAAIDKKRLKDIAGSLVVSLQGWGQGTESADYQLAWVWRSAPLMLQEDVLSLAVDKKFMMTSWTQAKLHYVSLSDEKKTLPTVTVKPELKDHTASIRIPMQKEGKDGAYYCRQGKMIVNLNRRQYLLPHPHFSAAKLQGAFQYFHGWSDKPITLTPIKEKQQESFKAIEGGSEAIKLDLPTN